MELTHLGARMNMAKPVNVAMMKSVGLGSGQSSDVSALDPVTRTGLQRAMVDGLPFLKQVSVSGGNTKFVNHRAYGNKAWGRTAETRDRLTHAATQSLSGMQEHHIEEVVKLRAHHDGDGRALDGSTGRYTIRFEPGQDLIDQNYTPPAVRKMP